MSCEQYRHLIDDLVEDELDNPTQLRLHLLTCTGCDAVYENLLNEKRTYAQYLYAAEPPAGMWAKIEQQLDAETSPKQVVAGFSNWKDAIFAFFRANPTLVTLSLVVTSGLGFLVFLDGTDNGPVSGDITAVGNYLKTDELPGANPLPRGTDNGGPGKPATFVPPAKPPATAATKIKAFESRKSAVKQNQPGTGNQVKELGLTPEVAKMLDTETAKQMEKIEILLRSFRNTKVVDGADYFDTDYEKEQAGRLLEKNAALRRIAARYGNMYTAELLDRAEPLLLDIANLENRPVADKVIQIKERVKNQNIIASLQAY